VNHFRKKIAKLGEQMAIRKKFGADAAKCTKDAGMSK